MLRIGLEVEAESGEASSEQASREPTQPEFEAQRLENYEVVKREDGSPVELGRAIPWHPGRGDVSASTRAVTT